MSIVTIARSHIRSATIAALGVAALLAAPVAAQQIETIDPDIAVGPIEGDLSEQPGDGPIYADEQGGAAVDSGVKAGTDAFSDMAADVAGDAANDAAGDITGPSFGDQMTIGGETGNEDAQVAPEWADPVAGADDAGAGQAADIAQSATYKEDDLIGAAEGVFGKGAEGVAKMIQGLLKDQGEPSAYIVGREAGGAFIIGARYGSGTLFHKVEGEQKVYWTGPSIGFDAGANAGNTFVLVYNLYDSEELFKRFPAGEGQAYLVGGLHASYMRRGDKVLIPIRVGAGLRLGVNAGYMRFSKKQRWLPF
jgi:hypothetical protein